MFKFSGENPDFKRRLKKFDPRDHNTWPALVAGVVWKAFGGHPEIDEIEQECLRQIEEIIFLSEARDQSGRLKFICGALKLRAKKCLSDIHAKRNEEKDYHGKLPPENTGVAAERRDSFSVLPVGDYRTKATIRGELETLGRRHARWESDRAQFWDGFNHIKELSRDTVAEADAGIVARILARKEYLVYELIQHRGMTYEKVAEFLKVEPTAVAAAVRRMKPKLEKAGLSAPKRSESGIPLAVSRAAVSRPDKSGVGISRNPKPDVYDGSPGYRRFFFDAVRSHGAYLTAQPNDGRYFASALANRNRIKTPEAVTVSKCAA